MIVRGSRLVGLLLCGCALFRGGALGAADTTVGQVFNLPFRLILELTDRLETYPTQPDATHMTDLSTRHQGVDWPRFLGPTGDNKSSERGILTHWPAAGPRLVWHKAIGESYGMPAISRGRLFLFERVGESARLSCLTSETGRELWHFDYPSPYHDLYGYDAGPRAAPVVDGDRVYIFGVEGMLHCLDAGDGHLIWKLDTQEKFHVIQNFFGVGSTPVVEGNLLIAQIGGSPADNRPSAPTRLDQVKPNGTGVVAFDKLTGEVKYQIADELASYSSPTLATIGGRRWCFVLARGGLVAFEPASGKIDFQYPWRAAGLESVNAANPVVVDDLVLISETYGPGSLLLRVKPGGYEVVWKDEPSRRQKILQTHWNTPIVVDGYIYGSSGRHENNAELRCVELKTGKLAWAEKGLGRASLLYADGHFICLCERGELILFKANPNHFEKLATAIVTDPTAGLDASGTRPPLLEYPAWAAPILSHGLLYVRGKNELVCLELIPEK